MIQDDILLEASHGGRTFQIADAGAGCGFYLYVIAAGRCTHDYLQDSVEIAQQQAHDEFSVPYEAWHSPHSNA